MTCLTGSPTIFAWSCSRKMLSWAGRGPAPEPSTTLWRCMVQVWNLHGACFRYSVHLPPLNCSAELCRRGVSVGGPTCGLGSYCLSKAGAPPPFLWTLHVLLGVARGLKAGRDAGVIHMDVKTENVVIDDPKPPWCVLVDRLSGWMGWRLAVLPIALFFPSSFCNCYPWLRLFCDKQGNVLPSCGPHRF
jgi:hypothetical protein